MPVACVAVEILGRVLHCCWLILLLLLLMLLWKLETYTDDVQYSKLVSCPCVHTCTGTQLMQHMSELVRSAHTSTVVIAPHHQHCTTHQPREVITKSFEAQGKTADLTGWGAEGAAGGIELP